MSNQFNALLSTKYLRRADALTVPSAAPSYWNRAGLSGRLVELCGREASATLTAAFGLVLDAQRQEETVAWITALDSLFFPPDAAQSGIDLEALAVVRVPRLFDVARAADKLARSGAFGLLILDLDQPRSRTFARSKHHQTVPTRVPAPLMSRLLGLAQKHDLAIVFLTRESRQHSPSLGSLVSLRGRARQRQLGYNRFEVEVQILKDKRRAPNWHHEEPCDGPAGLC